MQNNANNFPANIQTAEFAKMCGTSKRTLIHYEEIGLFSPQRRESNGYRYYSEQQYEVFQVIDTLKSLGMPLRDIKAYLERRSPEELDTLLRAQAKKVETELEKLRKIRRIIATKQALLTESRQVSCDTVHFCHVEEEFLLLSDPVDSSDPEQVSSALRRHLAAYSRSGYSSGHPFGAMIGYSDILQGRFSRYAYFFTKLSPEDAPEGAYHKPAGTYAVIYLRGDYRQRGRLSPSAGLNRLPWAAPWGYSYKEGIIDEIAAKDASQYLTRISILVQ